MKITSSLKDGKSRVDGGPMVPRSRRVREPLQHQLALTLSATHDSAAEGASRKRAGRRYELDWLRAVVVLGLIPYHVAVVFSVGPGDYIKSGERSFAFDVGATLVAFIGMPLLFLISGAATWYALGRRKPSAYMGERIGRLAVPLVFGILVLVPIQLYFDRLNVPGYHLSYLQFYGQFLDDWLHITQLGVFGRGFQYWGHLWFLVYLLAVSLFLLPLLAWLRRGQRQKYVARLAGMAQHPLGLLLLGGPLALVEVVLQGPIGSTPVADYNNLYSGAAGLILYAVAFVLGYLLVSDATFQLALVRYRAPFLAMGALLLVAHECILGAFGLVPMGGPLAISVVRLLRGLITWCLLVSALGFASRYLSTGTRLLRSLNEACFPLYVLHMPILTIFAYFVVRWHAPVLVEFAMLVLLTAFATFVVYEGLVRRTPVLRFLFGLKARKPVAGDEPGRSAPVQRSWLWQHRQ